MAVNWDDDDEKFILSYEMTIPFRLYIRCFHLKYQSIISCLHSLVAKQADRREYVGCSKVVRARERESMKERGWRKKGREEGREVERGKEREKNTARAEI